MAPSLPICFGCNGSAIFRRQGYTANRGGDWVNEDSDLTPTRRARPPPLCWRKQSGCSFATPDSLPLHIFRLAGIARPRPQRHRFPAQRHGQADRETRPGLQPHPCRRHRHRAIASMARPNPGAVYNVCDDNPAPPDEVVAYAAELLGIAAAAERAVRSKRNSRRSPTASTPTTSSCGTTASRKSWGCACQYPDYRSGLQAILAGDASAADVLGLLRR